MKPSPCKDCEKREQGCHGKCQAYIDYRKKCDEDIKRRNKERQVTTLRFSQPKKERAKNFRRRIFRDDV